MTFGVLSAERAGRVIHELASAGDGVTRILHQPEPTLARPSVGEGFSRP